MDDLILGENEQSENENAWTETDKDFISICVGLLKATRSSLKKVCAALKANGQCDTSEKIAQIDDINDVFLQVSPAVDNLVSGLYAPLQRDVALENVSYYSTGCLKLFI